MAPFNFRSDKHFVTSSDGTTLQVNELTKPLTNPSSIQKSYWKPITTINMSGDDLEEDEDNDVNTYNGLLFFDGHGLIQGREALTLLARHLSQLHLLVNPAGYCFQDVSPLGGHYPDFGIHYLRLNDLFSWPHHEVGLVSTNQWHRHELKYHHVPRRSTTSNNKPTRNKEKQYYEELMKKKDEELAKLEETNEAQREEVEKLRKEKDAETKKMSKMLKKKKVDDEAKEKRIEELEKSKEELEEKMELKEEELQNVKKEKKEELRKLLVKKDNEIRLLRNSISKDDESQRSFGDPKTVLIGAKDMRITWGENSKHWKWRSDPDSRLGEVAELLNVWWFDVTGKIDMGTNRMLMTLPEKATYVAYFVFKMSSNAQGFGNEGIFVEVGVGGRNVSNGVVYLRESGSRKRGDGWLEVKMGDFSTVGRDAEGAIKDQHKYCVDLKLYNHMGTLKTGLVVYGIELRPN